MLLSYLGTVQAQSGSTSSICKGAVPVFLITKVWVRGRSSVIFPKSKAVSGTAAWGAAAAAGMGRAPQAIAPAHRSRTAPIYRQDRGCPVILRLLASLT